MKGNSACERLDLRGLDPQGSSTCEELDPREDSASEKGLDVDAH